jgi:hypothetical protein
VLKVDTNRKYFCMFKALKPQELTILIFFQLHLSFLLNVHHSFWKLERILMLMIKMAKGFELMKISFITNLNTFGSKFKPTFDPKNYGFWKCGFNKCYSYLCNRRHECINL